MNVSTSGSIIILLLHLAQYDYFTGSTINYKNTINTKVITGNYYSKPPKCYLGWGDRSNNINQ